MAKIDFVVAWVDGSDKAWQAEKSKYSPQTGSDATEERYRDWDILRYWFRGVEKFAPWVNKIYFVTWGHLPAWLDVSNPKLVIVKHEDYIPGEYLPTFSSHPIELNLHRIKGLSEQFVYFNDDMFLVGAVKPTDFFVDGRPCDTCIETAVMQDDYSNPFAHILLNNTALLNQNFQKRETIRRNKKIWFSPAYGLMGLRNLLMLPYGQFSSFKFFHTPSPFLKATFDKVWEAEPQVFDQTCRNRFRSPFDVNQYLLKYWQYATGCTHPVSPGNTAFLTVEKDDPKIRECMENGRCRMLCINDESVKNFEKEKLFLQSAFEKLLPDACSFEK